MKQTTILLNGIDYTADCEGLTNLIFEFSENSDNKSVQRSISNVLTFTGEAFTMLEEIFIINPDGESQQVNVTIFPDCCSETFSFVLPANLIEYCPGCYIEAKVVNENAQTLFYKELNEKVFYTGRNGQNFAQNLVFPKVYVGLDNLMILVIWTFIFAIAAPIFAVFSLLSLIVNAVNNIPGVDINLPNFVDELTINALLHRCVGGDKYRTTVKLSDIFAKNATMLGGLFQSSILNSGTYANTVLFSALNGDGTDKDDNEAQNPNHFDPDSFPNFTPIQLLKELSLVFNADYKITKNSNGTPILQFERKDYFETNGQITLLDIDAETEKGNAENPCFKLANSSVPASFEFSYSRDALDVEGNNMINTSLSDNELRASYYDRVENNPNGLPARKGIQTTTVNFGAVRAQNDIKSRPFYDGIRDTLLSQSEILIMEREQASLPKLLLLKPGNELNAKMISRPSDTSDKRDYNFPFYFNENYQENEIIKGFFATEFADNPAYQSAIKYTISDFKWHPENFCQIVQTLNEYGTGVLIEAKINGIQFRGKAENIKADFENTNISFSNIKLKQI